MRNIIAGNTGSKTKDVDIVSFSNGHSGVTPAPPTINKDGEPFGGFAIVINGHSLVCQKEPIHLQNWSTCTFETI